MHCRIFAFLFLVSTLSHTAVALPPFRHHKHKRVCRATGYESARSKDLLAKCERWRSSGITRRTRDYQATGYETPRSKELLAQCEERWRSTKLDHFSFVNQATFKQRYFYCDSYYKPGGPIFFYLGNEADVTLYLNNTGLMWELAPKHNALLIFAEHRYYGQSRPQLSSSSFSSLSSLKEEGDLSSSSSSSSSSLSMGYLTSEQAMADYASLIWELKTDDANSSKATAAVIGFGGSYGGMLATWFRLKYPHLMDGAIAASAPIWSFAGEEPPYDTGGFAEAVTWDASSEGGSAAACVPNARAAWQTLFDWGSSEEGRARIAAAMRLCSSSSSSSFMSGGGGGGVNDNGGGAHYFDGNGYDGYEDHEVLPSKESVENLADWATEAWAYLAMGDYPYPSDYILNGEAMLPAYPVRVACDFLSEQGMQGEALLAAMADAVGVFYNATGALKCFDYGGSAGKATEEDATFWDFQYCSEQFMPQSQDGERDMFWSRPVSYEEEKKRCQKEWGVTPSKYKATIEWGGRRISEASNIVFSNGGRDPWRSGGVLDSLSDSLVAVFIPEGAHHLDLMFSHEDDPESVKKAREIEEEHIVKWIGEVAQREEEEERKKKRGGDGANKLVSSSLGDRAVAVVVVVE